MLSIGKQFKHIGSFFQSFLQLADILADLARTELLSYKLVAHFFYLLLQLLYR